MKFIGDYVSFQASLVAQLVKNLLAMQETWVQSLGWEDPWGMERLPTPVFWPGEFMDCIVRGVTKSQTRLSDIYFHVSPLHPPLTPLECKLYKS